MVRNPRLRFAYLGLFLFKPYGLVKCNNDNSRAMGLLMSIVFGGHGPPYRFGL